MKAAGNWLYNLPSRAVGVLTRSKSGKTGPTLTGALEATARQWESAGLTEEEMGGVPGAYREGAAAVGAFYIQAINEIGWVVATEGASKAVRGFGSMSSFKRAYGSAGDGRVWHHIVEKRNVGRFGREAIHSTQNIVSIPEPLHRKVNALYSSKRPYITGSHTLTVRQWLSSQSFKAQREFGLTAIYYLQRGTW